MSLLTAQYAPRMDVVFEDVLLHSPNLRMVTDEPALAGGWFGMIELKKPD